MKRRNRFFNLVGIFILKLKSALSDIEVDYINGPESLPAPLLPDVEQDYLIKHENGDKNAREELIVHNLRLVVYIAKNSKIQGYRLKILYQSVLWVL